MIKKLRIKFIIINMSFVSVVLLSVLAVLCISNYQKYVRDADMTLEAALRDDRDSLKPMLELPPPGQQPAKVQQPGSRDPVFIIESNGDGMLTRIDESGMQVAENAAEAALLQVQEDEDESGILRSLQLRYRRQKTVSGERVAFMDCSREISGMKNLFLMSVFAFAGSMLVFLAISFFLAKWALEPVERAWEQQRRFIADASHELKTPLTVILANLGILASHREDTIAQQEKWLKNTDMEAKRMQKLLEDLLFLARSDAAGTPAVFAKIDLSSLLWSCILPFEPLAYENEAVLSEEIEEGLCINGDEKQIRQLTAILMDNACKYVDEKGSITVRLARRQEKIELSVANTGVVIPKEEREHIFERFYRVDKSRARKENGYGLGLSIAAVIVENHHGKIKVSREGEKTVFTVSFLSC